jgi:hypothetical protein
MGYSWDENTKFFFLEIGPPYPAFVGGIYGGCAGRGIKYNKNTIMSSKDLNGKEKFKHDKKATILWESLGRSEFSHMHFNL